MRQLGRLLLATAILTGIGLYLLPPGFDQPSAASRPGTRPSEEQNHYQWRTFTSFPHLDPAEVANMTTEELCQHFPHHKLNEIQPILKTGHGVIERARQSLISTSACLDDLLIFSDLSEDLGNHHVIDVIADIPQHLLRSTNQTDPYFAIQEAVTDGTLKDSITPSVDGWAIDKFKFLTSVSRAWLMAPEKRWYVFYEGDTYIVWDTVFRLLEQFDPDVPHYFGSPSPGVKCKGDQVTWQANGGSGFILSRSAMRKFVKDDFDSTTGEWRGSRMVERYWDETVQDCCGDSVLGWALWNEVVDLKGLWPMFQPHPLDGVPFSEAYWCQPVLSLHKTDPVSALELWRHEWSHRNTERPLLFRDLAVEYFNFTNLTTKADWDNGEWDSYRPSPDDPNNPDESAEHCGRACESAVGSGCFQWTYHLRRCYFVRSFRYGRSKQPLVEDDRTDRTWSLEEQRFTAGWNTANIQRWIAERPCHEVQWVKPSIKRIF